MPKQNTLELDGHRPSDVEEDFGIRDRSVDYLSDVECDLMDDEDDVDIGSSASNERQNLEKAAEAPISRERSMKRTLSDKAEVSSAAKSRDGESTHVNVSPHRRLEESTGEMLSVSGGKLFFNAGKEMRKMRQVRQQTILKSWDDYQNRHSLAGAGLSAALPQEQSLQRIETTTAMLKLKLAFR